MAMGYSNMHYDDARKLVEFYQRRGVMSQMDVDTYRQAREVLDRGRVYVDNSYYVTTDQTSYGFYTHAQEAEEVKKKESAKEKRKKLDSLISHYYTKKR
jgi:hypothetical protein